MNITDEETERFLNLIKPECRSYAIKALSNTHTSFVYIEIGIGYCYNYIKVTRDGVVSFIELNPVFAPFKKDDADFIMSYISRCFDKFKLIFSSSIKRIFVKNTRYIDGSIGCFFDAGDFKVVVSYHNRWGLSFDLSENNADVSDEIWDIILSNQANVNCMMSEYVSGTCPVSDNIKKRLQALYDSLSDSDKLLLELGEDLTNI